RPKLPHHLWYRNRVRCRLLLPLPGDILVEPSWHTATLRAESSPKAKVQSRFESTAMPESTEPIRVLMTQLVPAPAIEKLKEAIGEQGVLDINPDPDRIWTKAELIEKLRADSHNALYCMLTNPIDAEVLDAAPDLRIVANMAVGYNNIDVAECTRQGIVVSNTP